MFTTDYKISMPLSGVATSWFERGTGDKFAYLAYDVQKGLKWNMKFYLDEAPKDAVLEANQLKLTVSGEAGYEFKDLKTGMVLGAWIPQKRFLNLFLRAPYKLVVEGDVVATSPGDSFFKLMIPGAIRKMIARKVIASNGCSIAKISAQSALGCGVVKVRLANGKLPEEKMSVAVAVLAAICGLQD